MIYIVTGAIRTGKTTALLHWADSRQDTNGILSPDDANGTRCFLKLKPRQKLEFEVKIPQPHQEVIHIGRFYFLKDAFSAANAYIMALTQEKKYRYLILDEIGKLELKNTGLHAAAKNSIKQHEYTTDNHLILVIRDTLLRELITHYGLTKFRCITKEELHQLQ